MSYCHDSVSIEKTAHFARKIRNCFNHLTVVHHRHHTEYNQVRFQQDCLRHHSQWPPLHAHPPRSHIRQNSCINLYSSDQLSGNYTDLQNRHFSHRHTFTKCNTTLGAGNCFVTEIDVFSWYIWQTNFSLPASVTFDGVLPRFAKAVMMPWSAFLGHPLRDDLINPVKMSIREYVHLYVHNETQCSHKLNSGIC